ncbi:hypothetical protein SISSUDRAFT_1039690 [Sistotremastrum suecicum HHB10207 ss-3]|uniref:DH domain-containing protein n=1 Tax=Sistotremastrum suecicum HHB10207 ss-3 TaxID=1314776 RepID=A0A166IIY0_9AGAM|nr:hypothetical protein SISSUDRAFT_1039690 [Sistotremastrum suecicum HHB10207 ss-3]
MQPEDESQEESQIEDSYVDVLARYELDGSENGAEDEQDEQNEWDDMETSYHGADQRAVCDSPVLGWSAGRDLAPNVSSPASTPTPVSHLEEHRRRTLVAPSEMSARLNDARDVPDVDLVHDILVASASPKSIVVPHENTTLPPPSPFSRPQRKRVDILSAKPTSFPDVDPSVFPDPYPSHPWSSPVPALSSGSSSSARSSAYTNPGSALRNSSDSSNLNVLIVPGAETDLEGESPVDGRVGVGITSDMAVQLSRDSSFSSVSRVPVASTHSSSEPAGRWSAVSNRSSADASETTPPNLRSRPSYDQEWQAVDERDEIGLTSGDETDDEEKFSIDGHLDADNQRTVAAVIADEGRGTIVNGVGIPIQQLEINLGTTHLLLSSNPTPNLLPSILPNVLPSLSHSLLALDISANFLPSLPSSLGTLVALEELNIACNPLRAIPLFLTALHRTLRVLIADSVGLSTLPPEMGSMKKLAVLSLRRNKMISIPECVAQMESLEDFRVDGNPFLGPWKALAEPLMQSTPGQIYIPGTPGASSQLTSTSASDDEPSNPLEEEDTIRAPLLSISTAPANMRSFNEPSSSRDQDNEGAVFPRTLTRTLTTPSRPFVRRAGGSEMGAAQTQSQYHPSRSSGAHPPSAMNHQHATTSLYHADDSRPLVRRMRSANELRQTGPYPHFPPSLAQPDARSPNPHHHHSPYSQPSTSPSPSPRRPSNGSASNLLSHSAGNLRPIDAPPVSPLPSSASDSKKYATLGSGGLSKSRQASAQSLFDPANGAAGYESNEPSPSLYSGPGSAGQFQSNSSDSRAHSPLPWTREKDKPSLSAVVAQVAVEEKKGKWGFLKKMSMGKIRPAEPIQVNARNKGRPGMHGFQSASIVPNVGVLPENEVSASSTGPSRAVSPSPAAVSAHSLALSTSDKATREDPKLAPFGPSLSLLAPPNGGVSPTPRSSRRRSFLPLDAPPSLNIPIPSTMSFIDTGMAAITLAGDEASKMESPASLHPSERANSSPATEEHFQLEDEVRSRYDRERTTRALRSIMAYLRDMSDLGVAPASSNPTLSNSALSTPGLSGTPTSSHSNDPSSSPESTGRMRRPNWVDFGPSRMNLDMTMSTISLSGTSTPGSSVPLRASDSSASLRDPTSGTSSNTISMFTNDSGSSGGIGHEERKHKDDKGRRAKIIREIVETERTYVKGLQELMDIYVQPASQPVNLLGTSTKETVVPLTERKIVFNGIDGLYKFHLDSFLPLLEAAAAPLLSTKSEQSDVDGTLSITAAKAVATVFLSHAAFMKMYSSYINNFDSAVQRLRLWTTKATPGSTSGSATLGAGANGGGNLVGLGLAASAGGGGGILGEGNIANSASSLSTSQRKRIKSYMKRCRLNPRHSQLNLEGYLLLPVQRIPRYRMLLEELVRNTPPQGEGFDDALDKALAEISSLATNMNEGKRDSESRRKLVQWQTKIRGKFPSPLVQPHRRLVMDGPLHLTRVVRKSFAPFEVTTMDGDTTNVQVECLAPEITPRDLIGILCNDLLVLCKDATPKDPAGHVDLWAVLRMQTLPQPASIVQGNCLRLVDNKAILYFEAPSTSDALTWCRAINLNIPASKT